MCCCTSPVFTFPVSCVLCGKVNRAPVDMPADHARRAAMAGMSANRTASHVLCIFACGQCSNEHPQEVARAISEISEGIRKKIAEIRRCLS